MNKTDNDGEMKPSNAINIWLRSCSKHTETPIKATVKGKIPSWLTGSLLRNGPGLKKVGNDEYKHLFDGLALMQKYSIKDGQVFYQSKYLESDTYLRNMKANRIVVNEFGTRSFPDPCKSILGRFMSYFSFKDFTDNCNVNFYPVGDQIFASTETPFIRRIDPKTLDTHEKIDLSKFLTVNTSTAHPHIDEQGNVYNLGSRFGRDSSYNIIKIPSGDKPFENATIECSIKTERPLNPAYYHSFLMTDNYYIFIEQPLVVSVPTLMSAHFTGASYANSLKWKPQYLSRFHLMNRKDGSVFSTYTSDAFMFFHTINAFEEDGHIVADICCYSDAKSIQQLTLGSLGSEKMYNSISQVRRYVMPLIDSKDRIKLNPEDNLVKLKSTTAKAFAKNNIINLIPEALTEPDASRGELPRINYKLNGKKYRYCYSLSNDDDQSQLLKLDTQTKECTYWCDKNHFPSEPVFVENPGAQTEDDGIVLSAVLSHNDSTQGYLVILDAKSFKEIARACYQTESSLTADFHGVFIK